MTALRRLAEVVDVFWPEVADAVSRVEELYENKSLAEGDRELAALIVSKVYFHLGAYEDALQYALGSGSLFLGTIAPASSALHPAPTPAPAPGAQEAPTGIAASSSHAEYVATMVGKCIDTYIRLRKQADDRPDSAPDIDPRLERLVLNHMFLQCLAVCSSRPLPSIPLQ